MAKVIIFTGISLIFLIAFNSLFILAADSSDKSVKESSSNSLKLSSYRILDDSEEDDSEEDAPITGNALNLASASALEYIGEGRVTDTEIGDEEGYYEIEITLDDGIQADVHLDENFRILSVEYENEEDD